MAITKAPVAEFMKGKDLVLEKLVPCLVNALIGGFLALIGGMHGFVLVLDKVRAGEEVGPTDVLGVAFDDLVNRILFWVPLVGVIFALGIGGGIIGYVLGMISAILGLIFQILMAVVMLVVMVALGAFYPYALISVARDQTPWMEAWKKAVEKVKGDFKGNGLYMIITGVLGSLGAVCCFFPVYLTLPMGLIAQIEGYEEAGGLA